jgi:simple sugar transport system ATP-binding protein
VDVGAIEFIHRRLFETRDAGAGILLISSELEEVLRLADRVLVFYAGKIVAEFSRAAATESNVGFAMTGSRHA